MEKRITVGMDMGDKNHRTCILGAERMVGAGGVLCGRTGGDRH